VTPRDRIRVLVDRPVRADGAYVLYWMIGARRLGWNFALDRAVELSRTARLPLLIFEPLRVDYPWASERTHAFVLDGMAEHAAHLEGGPVGYLPYVEPSPGAGRGLLEALAAPAAAVVTDEALTSFLPRAVEAAARRLDTRLEAVDGNGLLPLWALAEAPGTAHAFRRRLHRLLPERFGERPQPDPFRGPPLTPFPGLPSDLRTRWPSASAGLLRRDPDALGGLPIDHEVPPASERGGSAAGRARLRAFVVEQLPHYAAQRNDPDADCVSRLSPYLHFGHVSAHEVFAAVADAEGWTPLRVSGPPDGRRRGWWGMSESAEAFLDQLVTWRELGHLFAARVEAYRRWESLPAWARATLEAHAADPRPWCYDIDAFEGARTHDPLWNAAQRQLVREGRIHNYLRMLWGKKILEWSAHPREALATMIALNDRWALDGRDPNSYAGIFWVFGRFDRGWPERAVFGRVRSMSSERTARKVALREYLARYGPASPQA